MSRRIRAAMRRTRCGCWNGCVRKLQRTVYKPMESMHNSKESNVVPSSDLAAIQRAQTGTPIPREIINMRTRAVNPFRECDAPFSLAEIAGILGIDYEAVRSTRRRLEAKPETRDKVKPIGNSRHAEYSAEAANFIARRCLK